MTNSTLNIVLLWHQVLRCVPTSQACQLCMVIFMTRQLNVSAHQICLLALLEVWEQLSMCTALGNMHNGLGCCGNRQK